MFKMNYRYIWATVATLFCVRWACAMEMGKDSNGFQSIASSVAESSNESPLMVCFDAALNAWLAGQEVPADAVEVLAQASSDIIDSVRILVGMLVHQQRSDGIRFLGARPDVVGLSPEAMQSLFEESYSFTLADGAAVLWPPLHYAAYIGDSNLVSQLVALRPSVMYCFVWGSSPLHIALREGHEDVAKLLMNFRVDFRVPNQQGLTPLHFAAERGYENIVRFLLAQPNMEPNAVTAEGDSPLDLAVRNNRDSVVQLLISQGARPTWRTVGLARCFNSTMRALVEAHCDELNKLNQCYGQRVPHTRQPGYRGVRPPPLWQPGQRPWQSAPVNPTSPQVMVSRLPTATPQSPDFRSPYYWYYPQ